MPVLISLLFLIFAVPGSSIRKTGLPKIRIMNEWAFKLTGDGSHTVHSLRYGEDYHSIHGAIQESMHVFIHSGLEAIKKQEIRVLEMGFGTGLNCLLTALYARKTGKRIYYHAIELHPLPVETLYAINYAQHNGIEAESLFNLIHECPWNQEYLTDPQFCLYKQEGDLLDLSLPGDLDLIYFDAFSPEKQPELWEEKIFLRIFNSMEPKGILVTYCAKGQVRRNMQAAGFRVERLPGSPGKREMLRAIKDL